jgi:hypothetical protein
MAHDTTTASDESATPPASKFESATPTAREASSKALFGVLLVLLVLVVCGAVWWYVGSASAANEAAAAAKLTELGAFVQKGQAQQVATINLSPPEAKENLDAIVAELPALTRLTNLNALGAPLTDEHLRTVGQLDSLEALLLQETNVTDAGMPHLVGLDNLINLDLYGTGVSDKGLESVGQLHSLKNLNIGNTPVTGDLSELARLQSLEWLLIPDMKLSDDVVKTLANLGRLSHLSINGSTISEQALDELRKKKPNLTIDR